MSKRAGKWRSQTDETSKPLLQSIMVRMRLRLLHDSSSVYKNKRYRSYVTGWEEIIKSWESIECRQTCSTRCEDFTYDNHKSAVLPPLAIQAENLQVLDVVDTLQPGHVVIDQIVGGNVRRPVGLEEISQLDERILRNFDELILARRCSWLMVRLRSRVGNESVHLWHLWYTQLWELSCECSAL